MQEISKEFDRLKNNTSSEKLKYLRKIAVDALNKGIESVDPEVLIQNSLKFITNSNRKLVQFKDIYKKTTNVIEVDLTNYRYALIVGGGKATAPMAKKLLSLLGNFVECHGLINIPYGQNWGELIEYKFKGIRSTVTVNYAGHPVPDLNGFNGTKKMIELIKKYNHDDTIIFVLISGGGSALMPFPCSGINLTDLQLLNSLLLNCGANIQEINSVRKHLSNFKGGNLTKFIYPKRGITLIISDVIGDSLDVIASGPTVPDSSTFNDAMSVLKKYDILDKLPLVIKKRIINGINGELQETPKKDDIIFKEISNFLIGSADIAKKEISKYLELNMVWNLSEKYEDFLIPIMKGEAKQFGIKMANILKNINKIQRRDEKQSLYYLINHGELTVTIHGKGKGGRNQEMLLSTLINLRPIHVNNFNFVLCSMAFDGIEGNSPAAGAILDSNSVIKAKDLVLECDNLLKNNNSHKYFKKMKDAIIIGQTQTNICDIICLIISI